MKTRICFAVLFLFCAVQSGFAQKAQDNWYLENTLTLSGSAASGGLNSPYGVAIGPDGRIYIADDGADSVLVYLKNGPYSFTISGSFGNGESFSQPRGMAFDKSGNMYVADSGKNCVYIFTPEGVYVRKIGGAQGSGPGQMSGVIDVAVHRDGTVFILERSNARISVFSSEGTFLRFVSGPGTLDSQLSNPVSLAVSLDNKLFVAQTGDDTHASVRVFTTDGLYLQRWNWQIVRTFNSVHHFYLGPTSIRVDDSGIVTTVMAIYRWDGSSSYYLSLIDASSYVRVSTSNGVVVDDYAFNFGTYTDNVTTWPCHAVGADGSFSVAHRASKKFAFYRRALRDQSPTPRNHICLPLMLSAAQRPNSSLIDIDYQVSDADDSTVSSGILIFKSGSQSLANCIRNLTFVEGTAANVGPGITANQPHRVTWDAGADWGVSLGDYQVAILAKDSRPNLLDIHYIQLPAGNGQQALTISRSPLIQSDFMQVWWWLLATGDPGIAISGSTIVGVGGAYDTKTLCSTTTTSADGRAYLYAKMNVREASAAEVARAKLGALPAGSTPIQTSTVSVGGRPKAVNEFGFDTGDWGVNAWWVVPLD